MFMEFAPESPSMLQQPVVGFCMVEIHLWPRALTKLGLFWCCASQYYAGCHCSGMRVRCDCGYLHQIFCIAQWVPFKYLPCTSGGVEALATVMGADSEPVLAGAAMQALTTLAGHVSARLAVLRDPSLLPTIVKCLRPGGSTVSIYYRTAYTKSIQLHTSPWLRCACFVVSCSTDEPCMPQHTAAGC